MPRKVVQLHNLGSCGMRNLDIIMMLPLASIMMEIQVSLLFIDIMSEFLGQPSARLEAISMKSILLPCEAASPPFFKKRF